MPPLKFAAQCKRSGLSSPRAAPAAYHANGSQDSFNVRLCKRAKQECIFSKFRFFISSLKLECDTNLPACRGTVPKTRHLITRPCRKEKVPINDAVRVNENRPENDEDINGKNIAQSPKIPHSDALMVVKTAFQYFEQQSTSVTELMFLRRLLNKAAKRRVHYSLNRRLSLHFIRPNLEYLGI
ncbi:hypothetical protein TNCV_602071 [Trichonephila clavipes]|nr:hypothetical protein TNCV_602071 [Trichonephila clavipes]